MTRSTGCAALLGFFLVTAAVHAGAIPLDSPFAPRTSPIDLERGFELLLEDRVFDARRMALDALKKNPRDLNALTLAGTVHVYLLELERAQEFFARASKLGQRSWELQMRSGDLEMARGNFKSAQTRYRQALDLNPRSPLIHLNLAATCLQDQRTAEGRSLLETAFQLGIRTREERVTAMLGRFLTGDLDGTARLLADYRSKYSDVATTLFIQAMLGLRAGKFEESWALLEKAADRGIQNAALVFQVANLEVALGRVTQAEALLSRALRIHTESAKLSDQYKLVSERLASARTTASLRRGVFEVTYETTTPKDLLERVLELSERHRVKLSKRLGVSPPAIKLKVLGTTGFASPAYYNNISGDITISGSFFRQVSGFADSFVSHALGHELSHFFVWSARPLATRSINSLWIDEGLAEYLSGGIGYLEDLSIEPARVFADGPLSMSDLIGNINMLWHDSSKNVKAYLQSFYMVDFLIRRSPDEKQGLARAMDLLQRVARDAPLETAITEVYGLSFAEFEKGFSDHIKATARRKR